MYLFGVNAQGRPWRRRRTTAGVWSPWLATNGEYTAVASARNGTPATAVAVGSGAEGVVEIVLTDDDGRVQSSRQTSPGASTWSAWRDLDGDWARFTIRKLAMAAPAGWLHLYGVNADGQVFVRSTQLGDPTRWGAWTPLPLTVRTTLPLTDAPQVTWPGDQQTLPVAPQRTHIGRSGCGPAVGPRIVVYRSSGSAKHRAVMSATRLPVISGGSRASLLGRPSPSVR